VQRTLFGIHLYDIALGSDGIVSVDSSHGYVTSGPSRQNAAAYRDRHPPSVECTTTSDQTLALLSAAVKERNLPVAVISAEIKALTILSHDGSIIDAIDEGRLTPGVRRSPSTSATIDYITSRGSLCSARVHRRFRRGLLKGLLERTSLELSDRFVT
jgi:hypothetical protein